MENRVGNSYENEFPKKSRSLDLKSLYEPKEAKQNGNLKRKSNSVAGDGQVRSKKIRKSRKEVSLSSIKNDACIISSSGSAEVYHGGLSLSLPSSKDSNFELSQKVNNGSAFKSDSVMLNDKVIHIPKRKRGLVGRKKFDGGHGLKLAGEREREPHSESGHVDHRAQLAADNSALQLESSKAKNKKGFDDFKESKVSEPNSVQHLQEKDSLPDHSDVKNDDLLLKKPQRNRRKRKNFPNSKSLSEAGPSTDNIGNIGDGTHKENDDDENLEQNAAMMLSSRFDPNCTDFTPTSKASTLPSMNGLPFMPSSGRDYVSTDFKSLSCAESASTDAAARILRPRKQHKEKGQSRRRKRRHFYEIFSGNLDAYWVLNRKIKVFWPLDQSWYYGLISEYDEETKLHHVKYDDRDEEWINLHSERFKLLLLPSEVPGKVDRKKSTRKDGFLDAGKRDLKFPREKENTGSPAEDDSYISSYMDSEPIISWLARSTQKTKSAQPRSVKKSKLSHLSHSSVSAFDETVNVLGRLAGCSVERDGDHLSSNSALPDGLAEVGNIEMSTMQNVSSQKGKKCPIVYVRRRYHNQTSEDLHISRSALEPVTYVSSMVEEHNVSFEGLDSDGPFWSTYNAGLVTIPLVESKQFKFDLKFPVLSVLNYAYGSQNLWLFHTMMLLQYGTLVATWPKIHLEMLFVDNVAGLRFLLFEGCLKQAVAFIFLILTVFNRISETGKFVDLQLPATSIRFKFSQFQSLRKQLVFAFHNFSHMNNSKWLYLDSKLERHCLFTKQLPLSECTYHNIKALQNGPNSLIRTSAYQEPVSYKGLQTRSRKAIGLMGISRDFTCASTSDLCHSDEKHRKLLPFALSFTGAPTFFVGLHLKLLMEHSVANISFRNHDCIELNENSGSSSMEDCSSISPKVAHENSLKVLPTSTACDGWMAGTKPDLVTGGIAIHSNGECLEATCSYQNGERSVAGASVSCHNLRQKISDSTVQLQKQLNQSEPEPSIVSSRQLVHSDNYVGGSSHSCANGLSVEIPQFNQSEKSVDREVQGAQQSDDLTWNMNGGIISSPNPTAPRSTGHRCRSSSNSSFGSLSHGWSDGNPDLFKTNFGNGPKKPRTQVSYSMPYGGMEFGARSRSHSQKGFPYKRIRKATEKKSSGVSRGSPRKLELLTCGANVLITVSDKGWRECGVHVVLELLEENEWRLAVKVSGNTKYSYKAHQFLQPGSTNRYTHAMMWKGGKDWTLEFPDRSQWAIFKEMHEECYNRNFRAALIKNIPIPGVRLIEENEGCSTEVAFVRSSKYFRQVETDIEMALDPSRVLYDMDSDDEEWIVENRNSLGEVLEQVFEKTMDMFEKASYEQQCDQFTSEEIAGLMTEVGSIEVITNIHEYWWQKRQSNGMPLIRHLQPPLWERYQQQLREWELAISKSSSSLSNGCQKTALMEKPPMFAFCLKPRGLEVPNKGPKQRSHRKISVSGLRNAIPGDQDAFHGFGRRVNGFAFGDEKSIYHGYYNYEQLDDSPLPRTSSRVISPRDASWGYISTSSEGFDRSYSPKLTRKKSKRFGFSTINDSQMVTSYNHRIMDQRNGVQRCIGSLPESPSQQAYQLESRGIEQFDGSDLDEFRIRDASGAAKHAVNMAKLKRENAQRLMYIADLAIHKAVVALTTAEAIKACLEDDQ